MITLPEPRRDKDVPTQANTKVDVYVRFKNAKENALGVPLPRGKVRVFKKDDADGSLEFVGEDLIDHTPKDETVLVKVGRAFDVELLRRYGLRNAQEGASRRTVGGGAYVVSYADRPPVLGVRGESRTFGRLRVHQPGP